MVYSYKLGPIRPPSEAYSLLLRVTMNCPWNRCKFCHTYKDRKFQLRTVEEIKQDIRTAKAISDRIKEIAWQSGNGGRVREVAARVLNDSIDESVRNVALWLYAGGKNVFLQDANSLIMRTNELVEVIRYLKETFPDIKRITTYARSKTAAKKKLEELVQLREAGLSRVHIGLESGYDPLLEFVDKGVTAAEHIKGGRNIVAAGLSLSEYVILGLGGKEMWREHALQTARVLNEIDPDFIRVRTLSVTDAMSLYNEIESGRFTRQTDEEIIEEERSLIENLECHSNFVSDHISNLLQEVEGKLPQDKAKMLAIIDRFQSLLSEERLNFRIGRRTHRYVLLDDLYDALKHQTVEQIISRLDRNEKNYENAVRELMQGFI